MDFALSEEQGMLAGTVRAFLEKFSPETEVRRLMETTEGHDPVVWARMAEDLGLPGLIVPLAHGGAGASVRDLAVVMEELGRALLVAPYLSTAVLAVTAIVASGDEHAAARHLPGIAAGTTVATAAVRRSGRADVRAVLGDGGHVLTGTVDYVIDGATADLLLVPALTHDGTGLFAVERGAPGLATRALSTMDMTRKLARVELDGAPAVLVGDGDGEQALELARRIGTVALAAEQLGGAQRCLELAVEYAKSRIQFGRLIGSFQAVKHMCAEMLVEIELARTAVVYAANCADNGDPDLPVAASMAGSYCSRMYSKVTAKTIQVHGGIGFTWEHPAHLYFKRAKSSELLFETPSEHRRHLLREIGPCSPSNGRPSSEERS